MDRITARDVNAVAWTILNRLQGDGRAPATAYLRITMGQRNFGITWGVRVENTPEGESNPETVPTVLDHALDGVYTTREAWLILTAILRTLDYRWETLPDGVAARADRIVSVALDGDVSVDGDVYGRVESTSTGAWLAIAEGARNGSRHTTRQAAINAVAALADTDH